MSRYLETILRWLLSHFERFSYRYEGALPEGYPPPGYTFEYKGNTGFIEFYAIVIHAWNDTAEIRPVVNIKGIPNLIYTLEMVGVDKRYAVL